MERSESPPPGRFERSPGGVSVQVAPPSSERNTKLGEPGRFESRPAGAFTYIVPSEATSMPGSPASRPLTTTGEPKPPAPRAAVAIVKPRVSGRSNQRVFMNDVHSEETAGRYHL